MPKGREVDKAKIEVIEKMSPPFSVRGVVVTWDRTVYLRYIKNFSKIVHP